MFKIIDVRYWILDLRVEVILSSNLKKRLPSLNTHRTRGKANTERAKYSLNTKAPNKNDHVVRQNNGTFSK
ncbi:hypothetical protein INT81_02490 [Riemerella anatipestifer]|nr:hypothetical protein [Riemerella anatipestifer]